MGTLNRWLKYAKAKVEDSVKAGNEKLNELEAAQAKEQHDRPWTAADGDTPTLDEARARIRWETEQAEKEARARVDEAERERADEVDAARASKTAADDAPFGDPAGGPGPAPDTGDASTDDGDASAPSGPTAPEASGTTTDEPHDPILDPILPATAEEAAARSAARIELEQRERDATARLEQIRRELGVDPPADPAKPANP